MDFHENWVRELWKEHYITLQLFFVPAGIAYRGRLLVAVSTEPVSGFTIVDETSANEPADEITRIPAVPEVCP